jgi:hypothetical protein
MTARSAAPVPDTSSGGLDREPAAAAAPRGALAAGAAAVLLLVLVGLAGESAAEPPLGPRTGHPPWDLGLGVPPVAVDAALVTAYLLGAVAVWFALRAVDAGWRPTARSVALAAVVAVGALVLVPPFGSADHLSYAAYGRIAAEGGDPYAVAPDAWPPGDPVVESAEVPWDDTTSVYGPVATAVHAAVAEAGGGSLRLTVWLWQLLVGASFLLTALLLHRLAGWAATRRSSGPAPREQPSAARARVAVLWTLNPLLLGVLVAGAHLDVLSGVAAVACLALAVRGAASRPLPFVALQLAAGVALGVAAGSKLPYAAAGAAVLWAHRNLPLRRRLAAAGALFAGAAAVLVPAHAWAGSHVYDQAREASRFTSLATPWRPLVNAASALGWDGARDAVPLAFAAVAVAALAAAIGVVRRDTARSSTPTSPRSATTARAGGRAAAVPACARDGAQALLVLGVAYVVTAPYVLPWYDALLFAPLALVAGTRLDRPLVLRLAVLALAYVPGRAAGEASWLTDVMLGFRQFAAPVVTGGVLVWLLVVGLRALRRPGGH